jgi:hypothetical protein
MGEPLKFILAALTICCLLGCRGESPEAKVRKAFEGCVQAVESQDAAGAVAPLAKDFQGPDGLDRGGARLYLMGILRREKVGITVLGNKVEVQGKEAHQVVELVLTSKGESLLPQDATHRVYHLRWRLEGDEWRLWRFEPGH